MDPSNAFALVCAGIALGILFASDEWDALAPNLRPSLSFYLSMGAALLALYSLFGA